MCCSRFVTCRGVLGGTARRMSVEREFETVRSILASQAPTRGVDAFALSLIKAERQVRKLFTHLVYQCPAFGVADVTALRGALVATRQVYFGGFLRGFDALYSRPINSLVGPDYPRLKATLDEAIDHRNKIFHGQLTSQSLSGTELVSSRATSACGAPLWAIAHQMKWDMTVSVGTPSRNLPFRNCGRAIACSSVTLRTTRHLFVHIWNDKGPNKSPK